MRNRLASTLALGVSLCLPACATSTESTPTTANVPAPTGIECPMCFTIVESVRSGLLPVDDQLHVQCERCCRQLAFFATRSGQVMMATGDDLPVPCDLAMPAPTR